MKPASVLARGEWWSGAVSVEADGNIVVEILGQFGDRALLGARYVESSAPLAVVSEIDSQPTGSADLESMLAHPLTYGVEERAVPMALEGVAYGALFEQTPPGTLTVDWGGTDLETSSWDSFHMAGRLLAWALAQQTLTNRALHLHLDGTIFRSSPRALTPPEQGLVDELIRRAGGVVQFDANDPRPVVSLNDGSMGSLRFMPAAGRVYSVQASELTFTDVDGVTVSAALYLDQQRMLFELDVVKADFTPLRRIPASF